MSDFDIVRDFMDKLGGHEGECERGADGACTHHRRLFAQRRAEAIEALRRLELDTAS